MEVMIKELGEIITGNTPSKKTEEFWNSEDICFVKPDIIADNGVNEIVDSNEYISEDARKKARVVGRNSIFVTCIGSIGKIGIASEGEYAFNQQINAIIPNDRVQPKYLAYNLLFNKSRLVAIANAPVVPIINKSQFGEFTINIETDIDRQCEIVDVLDKLTQIIQQRNKEISALDDLIKARFVELFGDPDTNPMNWDTYSLDECYEIASSKRILKSEWKSEGIPFLRVRDMVQLATTGRMDNEFFVSEEFYSTLKDTDGIPRANDILVSATSTLGKCHIVDGGERFYFKDADVLRFRAKKDINPVFFVEQMKSSYIEGQIARTLGVTTVAHFTIKAAKTINMRLPDITSMLTT